MSGDPKQKRRQRARLFNRQGGLCFWCKKPMILLNLAGVSVKKKFPPEMCTIDHLEPRWHPQRGQFNGEPRLVAACLKCNNERDRQQHAQLPRELIHAAAAGAKARDLAREYQDEISHIYPVIPVPKRKPLNVTFEPEPKENPGSLRVQLGELAKVRR